VSQKNDQLFGVIVILKSGLYLNNYLISVDKEISNGNITYFVLCYYNTTKRIEKEKILEIQFGEALLRAKKVRGCTILHSYDFVKHRKPLKNFVLGL